ncbi:hypothetical protein BD324DRAFT_73851 [Kockovaella imperatae]|uniref:Histone deacetylase domain-containing protein n=1 Tax=Kockovaella imperatae TaxID=4999 RepID=A0A1Y1UCF3_9TREE|nr:hypothetical protein BD324DRAFT_73851 [Kockovaella imperatae]ORX35728.1 hypothetical protein BD324DRAFT_73851 [Kockovaella imperatae]
MSRTAYIWSTELQTVADQLPANVGRSSMVHGLIHALDLLEDRHHDGARSGAQQNAEQIDADAEVEQDEDEYEDQEREEKPIAAPIPSLSGRATIVSPYERFASETELKRYHDAAYVDYLLGDHSPAAAAAAAESDSDTGASSSSRPRKRMKSDVHGLHYDCPPFPSLSRYATLVAASTLTACDLIANDLTDVAINWDGGRHHAMRNRASGFCYVADAVLGILHLVKTGRSKRRKGRPRVMYLDLDFHYGDGVAQAFLSPTAYPVVIPDGRKPPRPPQVLTLSVHHSAPDFFPPGNKHSKLTEGNTPHPFTLSIPLKSFPSASTYERVWGSIESVRMAFEPDYVVIQLGTDGLPGDRIGQYGNWSIDQPGGIRCCIDRVKSWNLPLCVLGGGGYHHPNTARAWAVATAALIDKELPLQSSIPDHEYFPDYSPSFTFELSQAHVRDENDSQHLEAVNQVFSTISERIGDIVRAHTPKHE